jgi:RimJ/RimL family protein N-acetyltransferase
VLTDRLRLEPISPAHADDLWTLYQDDAVAEWHGNRWTAEQARDYAAVCDDAWRAGGVHKWMAYDRVTGELVGRGGLSRAHVDGAERLEIGWALHERFWGQGYATEIGRAGLVFAFDDLDADDVVAFTEPHNTRSRAVMERLGMIYARDIVHDGAPFVLYSVSRRVEI